MSPYRWLGDGYKCQSDLSVVRLCIPLFFFKQETAYEIGVRLVGSEMCIRVSGCL